MQAPGYSRAHIQAKADTIVEHHYDESKPGKPLYLLIPGALVALFALALMIYIAYRAWYDVSLSEDFAIPILIVLGLIYAGGVYLFSYGYELYDVHKALRLTAIVVFITFAAVFMVAVLFAILGALGGSKSSSSSKSSESSKSSSRSTSSSSGGSPTGGGGIYLDFGGPTRTVTHQVVTEKILQPLAPQPIRCPNCGASYIPAQTKFICPNCGAPTPPELIQSSSAQS